MNGTPKVSRESYIWFNNQLVALEQGGTVFSVYSDQLNRPRKVLAPDQSVRWSASNRAFDRVVRSDSIGGLNIGFPGQYFDAESGLWQNWNRTYDASIGRYTQSDPIGLAGGVNTYAYVGANPLTWVDPEGLSPAGVQKIVDTFNRTVDSMTSTGARNSNPYVKNASNSLNRITGGKLGKPYLGCADQERVVRDQLEKRTYEDTWTFSQQANLVHRWGEARSSNPADPVIIYDPWKGKINVGAGK